MTVRLLGPNGSSGVNLVNPNNIEKVVDAGDLASDSFVKSRVGSAGVLGFRNKIVDGRFDFWYEGTSQTTSDYGTDTMWYNVNTGTTKVHSQQPLIAGVDLPAIEVPTAKYFSRTVVTSVAGAGNNAVKVQRIESVSTLAGKEVTISFYAKADAAKNMAVELKQYFGSTGSAEISVPFGLVSLSTAWKRYTKTITLPSIVGKTISDGAVDLLQLSFWFDAGSNYYSRASGLGQQSGTFDIACVQLEEGSVATPFEELPYEISQARVFRYFRPIYLSDSGYFTSVDYIRGSTFGGVLGSHVMRSIPVISGALSESSNISSISVGDSRYLAFTAAAGTAYFQWSGKADARL